MNQNNKPDWVVLSVTAIIIIMFVTIGLGDFYTYLATKQKNETIRASICKDWSVEQIQGLLNFK